MGPAVGDATASTGSRGPGERPGTLAAVSGHGLPVQEQAAPELDGHQRPELKIEILLPALRLRHDAPDLTGIEDASPEARLG